MTPHFTLHELTITQQRGSDGLTLRNDPGPAELANLRRLAETLLEPIRALWGCPVRVTSGYRGPEVERRAQKRPLGLPLRPSQHRVGQAADLVPLGELDIVEAFERIWKSDLPYDQLLLEQDGGVRWIHVSCAPDGVEPRGQAMWSPDNGLSWAYYKPGIAGGKGAA